MWDCPAPRGSVLQSSGLCTMACAVPLAAGTKLGRPSVPVLAFVGDAGLEMGGGRAGLAHRPWLADPDLRAGSTTASR